MAEESKERVQTVGELPVENFVALIVEVLDRKRTEGDPKLIDLSAKDFIHFMLEQVKSRAYQGAMTEAAVAQQVLTDWQAVEAVDAVTQPFRLKNVGDVDAFARNMRETFAPTFRGELVVVVAVANRNGTFDAFRK